MDLRLKDVLFGPTSPATTPRYDEIDIARGIGILLVVLGHALKATNHLDSPLYSIPVSVIYSFHMPLFAFLAGFTSYHVLFLESRTQIFRYVKKRALRLLIPYFSLSVLYIPIKILLSRYALKPYSLSYSWRILLGDSPNTVLWFLYVLFMMNVLCALFVRRKSLPAALLISAFVSACTCLLRFPDGLKIEQSAFRLMFYCLLGLFFRDFLENGGLIKKLFCMRNIVLAALLFSVGNAAYICYAEHGAGGYILTGVSGIFLTMALSLWLAASRFSNAVSFVGKNSMDIYILHDPLMTAVRILLWSILHLPSFLCTLFCFFFSFIPPIPLCNRIIRKTPFLRFCLLGEAMRSGNKSQEASSV